MADRKSLNIIGLILAMATLAVVFVGIITVQGHASGRYVFEQSVTYRPL